MRAPRLAPALALLLSVVANPLFAAPVDLAQPPNTWVKRSPLADTPTSPRLGYEGACAWDPIHRLLFRHGGHNQGGGGEQHAETWTFDPATAAWTLRETDTSPPGVCCAQQYLFDPIGSRFLRFPAFSGSHGWQWFREIDLNNASVWAYDLDANRFRSRAPCPEPRVTGLRCASWDSDAQVVVIFGGESCQEGTVVYDPHANEWTRMKPPKQPEFRSGGNMVYDAARKRHVLFGAQFSDDPRTWAYDLRKNEWTDLKPEGSPPTKENDAVLAYDAEHGVVVALVKITQGKDEAAKHRLETWAYDGAKNTWAKMSPPAEPDAGGNRTRVLAYAPELGLTLLENAIQVGQVREQQVWTYRYAERKPAPAALPPRNLRVTTGPDSAQLVWEAPPASARTLIYRGTGDRPWQVDFEKVADVDAKATAWRDEGLKTGVLYNYMLRSAGPDGRPGPDSVKVRTQPRIVEDVVVSVLSPSEVEVAWTPLPEQDVAGYTVERAVVEVATDDQLRKLKTKVAPLDPPSAGAVLRVGAFLRITCDPVKGARFPDAIDFATLKAVEGEPLQVRTFHKDDWDAAGKPYPFAVYAYRVRAVNALGVVGGPSPRVLTIPSIPRQVFSKEDGGTCRLKWAANPEKKLKGYRVYRMDGRYDKEPMTRLTPGPVADCSFADDSAGKKTRRYYVVAVDAIGQEGHPSSPVWYEREWKSFYKPFVGEWHQ
jgi:hypothetical protein